MYATLPDRAWPLGVCLSAHDFMRDITGAFARGRVAVAFPSGDLTVTWMQRGG